MGALALALLCVAQFVVVLDVTIVAVALPSMQRDLGFSATGLQWVVTGYTLVFGGLLIVAGRAADLIGRRRAFSAGMLLFAAASLACGLAWTPAVLVTARAFQGLGAAIVAPAALSILTATHRQGPGRRRAVGVRTAAAAGGGATGWLLGGLLAQALGWEWVFLVNVPVGMLAAALAPAVLQESHGVGRRQLDLAGASTVTAGLGLLVYGLTQAEQARFGAPGTWAPLAGGAGLLAAFLVIERRERPAAAAGPAPIAAVQRRESGGPDPDRDDHAADLPVRALPPGCAEPLPHRDGPGVRALQLVGDRRIPAEPPSCCADRNPHGDGGRTPGGRRRRARADRGEHRRQRDPSPARTPPDGRRAGMRFGRSARSSASPSWSRSPQRPPRRASWRPPPQSRSCTSFPAQADAVPRRPGVRRACAA